MKVLAILSILGLAAMSSAAAINVTERASYYGVGCDGIMLAQADTDQATAALKRGINGKTNSAFDYSGDTVAYYCQWRSGPTGNADSAQHAFDMMTDQCGLYAAGSYSDGPMDSRTYSYGYTNWRVMDYCNVPAGTRINGQT